MLGPVPGKTLLLSLVLSVGLLLLFGCAVFEEDNYTLTIQQQGEGIVSPNVGTYVYNEVTLHGASPMASA